MFAFSVVLVGKDVPVLPAVSVPVPTNTTENANNERAIGVEEKLPIEAKILQVMRADEDSPSSSSGEDSESDEDSSSEEEEVKKPPLALLVRIFITHVNSSFQVKLICKMDVIPSLYVTILIAKHSTLLRNNCSVFFLQKVKVVHQILTIFIFYQTFSNFCTRNRQQSSPAVFFLPNQNAYR